MWNIEKIRNAWLLASRFHKGQKYGGEKDGEQIEYLEHIGAVALEVQYAIQQDDSIENPELAILCAILHDILEDTDCPPETIQLQFGTDVLNGVQALTKSDTFSSKEEKMLDSLRRIKENKYPEVAMVKLADRICNLTAPPYYWDKNKMISYVKEAQLIYEHLKSNNLYLASRLKAKIEKYEIDFIGK